MRTYPPKEHVLWGVAPKLTRRNEMDLKTIVEISYDPMLIIKVTLATLGGGVIFTFILRSFRELGNWRKIYNDTNTFAN